ncbi:ferredoxin [Candidatus Parcubacteria bacterium]|nr:MAG: ferredoxin [Candidatus Parcubacteria bacterium]
MTAKMPRKKIKIKLNGQQVSCDEGMTILQVAREKGIDIPTLCQHDDFPPHANCRVCVVEVKNRKNLQTSCSTKVEEGMEIETNTDRVQKSRKTNLELIYADHVEKCPDCLWRFNCPLLKYAKEYNLNINRFEDRKGDRKVYKFANAVELDATQCIDCRNCIDACAMQGINYLEIAGKGENQEVRPVKDSKVQCILCGQCAVHCPVSAAQEQFNCADVEKLISKKKKTKVAIFAPSIRVSIGEEFGLEPGEETTDRIVSSLRQLGFDYVFDVNFAADVTTMVEAGELIERIVEKKPLPMMTSCCPAWVNYVEIYRPDLIPNITTSRSPNMHMGGIIKTYWAQNMGIKPKDIEIVSVMPCTAKKYEASRGEMKVKGSLPVDYVLTNRELAFLLKKNEINLAKINPSQADNPLGEYSGAAAIYGASGGVMESALRTAQYLACQGSDDSLCDSRLEFEDVRGIDGLKEAEV